MTVRIECDVEGLTGNWVEIQDQVGAGRNNGVAALPDDDSLYLFLRERESCSPAI